MHEAAQELARFAIGFWETVTYKRVPTGSYFAFPINSLRRKGQHKALFVIKQ